MGVISNGTTLIDQGLYQGLTSVDWDTTPKTATFTGVAGNGYFCNTSSGTFTLNLPAGSVGDIIAVSDYASTFNTNAITISPNGTDKINGTNDDYTATTKGVSLILLYVDSTRGWKVIGGGEIDASGSSFITATGGTITTCGNCKIHTFTGPGTFCVSSISSDPTFNKVGYMVIAGGGGAMGFYGGGGGAGGYREGRCSPVTPYTASPLVTTGLTVTATAFPITVGAGGSGQAGPACTKSSGSVSTFSTITSAGGGKGCGQNSGPGRPGADGGSGGGNGHRGTEAGAGNTPPVSPPQGNPGGSSGDNGYAGDGGGAAGQPGFAGTSAACSSAAGDGGAGVSTSITGSPVTRAGGGGGGAWPGNPSANGSGGAGGGGDGGATGVAGTAGTTNTGSGGGGGGGTINNGGAGGSGIVIIRYKFQ